MSDEADDLYDKYIRYFPNESRGCCLNATK